MVTVNGMFLGNRIRTLSSAVEQSWLDIAEDFLLHIIAASGIFFY